MKIKKNEIESESAYSSGGSGRAAATDSQWRIEMVSQLFLTRNEGGGMFLGFSKGGSQLLPQK